MKIISEGAKTGKTIISILLFFQSPSHIYIRHQIEKTGKKPMSYNA